MNTYKRKKLENKLGITAQTNSREMAEIDLNRCYKKRKSPDLSKMNRNKIDNRTIVFAKTKELLNNTTETILNRNS
ncbi:MAG: hypothetical protein ACOWWH_12430 [Eubacteriaceae bacterium]